MRLALKLWRLELYLVLGRVYAIHWDDYEHTCLRAAWRGRRLLCWGWKRDIRATWP